MDLNDISRFKELDVHNMLSHINGLPDQLLAAWQLGQILPLPAWNDAQQILIAGMGGSAIGADLLSAYAVPKCKVPIFVHRDYDLPDWAVGSKTLVICSSHSGNTEEALSVFEMAQGKGCRILVITTGGKLAELARTTGAVLWLFEYDSQPRAAVGYSFGLLLSAVARLGYLSFQEEEIFITVKAMKEQQTRLVPAVTDSQNPAKRLAGQLVGRWITIFGAEILAPVARRWKGQFNEVGKAQASFEVLPEADHNTLQGIIEPKDNMDVSMNIFLRASSNHPRNQLREHYTRTELMLQGINTCAERACGESRLSHMWTMLHFGDYTAYYLAMAYGVDPTPVPMLSALKDKMKSA
jgi:glucose/mannose-6-phosphate isomerase